MADEAEVTAILRFFKDGAGDEFEAIRQLISVAGKKFHRIRQTIASASETALNLGGITNLGLLAIKNLDTANSVHLRPQSGASFSDTWKAGEAFVKRSYATAVPYMQAENAPVEIDGLVVEA